MKCRSKHEAVMVCSELEAVTGEQWEVLLTSAEHPLANGKRKCEVNWEQLFVPLSVDVCVATCVCFTDIF